MAAKNLKFALNPIQWNFDREDPNDPDSSLVFNFQEPGFVERYPDIFKQIKAAGFDEVMLEVLPGQSLDDYAAMMDDAGVTAAPGYLGVPLPSQHGKKLEKGTPEWDEWYAPVKRRAEESKRFGVDSVVISADMVLSDDAVRWSKAAAVGADPRPDLLEEQVQELLNVAEILNAEGIRPGFHNHVGSLVETEEEIDYIFSQIDNSVMGASFDIGHLEWAGVDSAKMLEKYADRLVDVHVKDIDVEIAADSRANPTSYMRTTNRGLIRELGHGGLDLEKILDTLPDDFDGTVIVEVDLPTMEPFESAKESAEWIRKYQG